MGKELDQRKLFCHKRLSYGPVLFELLGLWVGEGSKGKGLYFGNTSEELLLHFLRSVEETLEFPRINFKVTVVLPWSVENEEEFKRKWSEILQIPLENFTNVSYRKQEKIISKSEYIQVYFNSIILLELMNSFYEKLKPEILNNKEFTISFLQGVFSGEGGVVLNHRKRVHHVHLSNKNMKLIEFVTRGLEKLGIKRGKYFYESMKFPIYGRKNFEKLIEIKIFKLHPEKQIKLENGFSKYLRIIERGEEVEIKILEQLLFKPMGYEELSKNLKKGRSTIQFTYIPKLIKKELVRYIGKKGRYMLFEITEKGREFLEEERKI